MPRHDNTPKPERIDPLELAQRLGSIANACRTDADSRARLHQWKKRYREKGLQALEPDQSHPEAVVPSATAGVVGRIIALALENPANGCQRISDVLTQSGFPLSHVSVQAILNRNHLGHRNARIQAIERNVLDGTLVSTPQRTEWIVSVNPCFAEREFDPDRPWATISFGQAIVSRIPGLGRLHLHAAVDTYSQTAFAVAAPDSQPEWPVSILHNDVLPNAKALGVTVDKVRTSNSFTYHGAEYHLFTLYLELNDIKQERRDAQDGHAQRFISTLLEDFVKKTRKRNYNNLERFQFELDSWIAHFNNHRELPGWPNNGQSPAQRLREWRDAHPTES